MFQTNPNRNYLIHRLWEQGRTVDEAAAELFIPRSTVGYYYRKFNLYAKEGRPIVLPQPKAQQTQEALSSAVLKTIDLTKILEWLNSGRIQELYYLLSVLKLTKELGIFATPEESKALRENVIAALNMVQQALKSGPQSQTAPQASQGPSLAEVLDRIANSGVKPPVGQIIPQGSQEAPRQGSSLEQVLGPLRRAKTG